METKKKSTRGRPKKDFWELREKINKETAENKWKLWRGRPRKEKRIDDSINTKISNHYKDIREIEKKNNEIHKNIVDVNKETSNIQKTKRENCSRILLIFSIVFFIWAVIYAITYNVIVPNNAENSSISNINNSKDENNINLQIWYNDPNWEFIEVENIEVNNNAESTNTEKSLVEDVSIADEYTQIIQSFYDKINNREFSSLSSMTDNYLKKSDSYRAYYNENRLSKFLDKIVGNKVYIWWFKQLPSTKENVKKYWYIIKYKVNWDNYLTKEDWEIAIVNRNWENLIWSIMCVTTWCSRMPFFQP